MTTADTSRNGGSPPTFRQLVDWVEGRLTRIDATTVDQAVRHGDDEIRKTVAWLRWFVRFGRQNPLPETPAIIGQRLRQSFRRHHGDFEPARRERAELMFDSRDDAVVAGMRGGPSLDEGYRLAFASPSVGVLLDVLPGDGEDVVRLEGQVLGPDGADPVWAVTVRSPSDRRTDLGGDDNGSFAIDRVPLDVERLVLDNGLLEVEVAQPLGREGE